MKKKIMLILLAITVCVTVFGSEQVSTKKFIITDKAPYTVYTRKDANSSPRPLNLTAHALPIYVLKKDGSSEIAVTMQFNETRTALLNENIYKQVLAACKRKGDFGTLYIELGGVKYTPVFQENCAHAETAAKRVDNTYHQEICAYCEKTFGNKEEHSFQDGVCTACGYGTKYNITVEKTEHGKLTVSPDGQAAEGTLVTITAAPDEGYVLANITVTDANGNEITLDSDNLNLTRIGNAYTFTAPPGSLP